jgi:hypothetical protein
VARDRPLVVRRWLRQRSLRWLAYGVLPCMESRSARSATSTSEPVRLVAFGATVRTALAEMIASHPKGGVRPMARRTEAPRTERLPTLRGASHRASRQPPADVAYVRRRVCRVECAGRRACEWAGQDSNLRPTDYESATRAGRVRVRLRAVWASEKEGWGADRRSPRLGLFLRSRAR